MARPRKENPDRKSRVLRSRATESEFAAASAKAAKAGLDISEYIRRMALHGRVEARRTDPVSFELITELKRVGNNLNQIAYHANIHDGEISPELNHTLAELAGLFDKIAERLPG